MRNFDGIPFNNHTIAKELCDRVSVGIHAERNGVFQHHTMGFLLALPPVSFLVTCRHTIVNVLDSGIELWIGPDDKLKGHRFRGTFHFPKNPVDDVAIAMLPNHVARSFSPHRFARLDDLNHSKQPKGTPCVLAGDLRDLSQRWDFSVLTTDSKLKMVTFFGLTAKPPTCVSSFDEKLHFSIGANNTKTKHGNKNEWKERDLDASYEGLSGTPVFAVDGDPFRSGWNPVDTKIIGVQSSFMELDSKVGNDKLLKVARIESVCGVVSTAFPEIWRNRRG